MKRIKPFILVPLLLIVLVIAAYFFMTREKVIVLITNGDVQGFTTHAATVRGVLKEADISTHPGDVISPPQNKWIRNKEIINITQASQVTVSDGDEVITFRSTEREVAALLALADINASQGLSVIANGKAFSLQDEIPYALYQQLEVIHPVTYQLANGDEISSVTSSAPSLAYELWQQEISLDAGITSSYPLQKHPPANSDIRLDTIKMIDIQSSYRDIQASTSADQVGHALAQAGTPIEFLDFSTPGETEPLQLNSPLNITSVTEKITLDQQIINFETQRQPVPDLEIDNQTLVQAGEYGLEAQRIRVRYENGEEISRKVEDKWTARESLPRIEGYGTNIVVRTTNTEHGVIEYWRALEFYATSYSASRSGVSPDKSWYGHVYCGGLLKKGFVGVDLNYIPCGTQMYIPGYGFATAMDTGSITGAWIDLGYDDNNYVAWHQNVTVYFLTPVPALDGIAYTIPPGSAN